MSSGTIHLYEFGPYRLDVQRHALLRADRIVPLAPKTFDLLLLLVQSEGYFANGIIKGWTTN